MIGGKKPGLRGAYAREPDPLELQDPEFEFELPGAGSLWVLGFELFEP